LKEIKAMKRLSNFRLESSTIFIVNHLSKELGISKTAVVEEAIKFYADKLQDKRNSILRFAGVITDDEADNMLESINNNKNSKNLDFSL
jgi:predicted DNA-binding protein